MSQNEKLSFFGCGCTLRHDVYVLNRQRVMPTYNTYAVCWLFAESIVLSGRYDIDPALSI